MTRRIRLTMAWLMVLSLAIGSGAFSAMAQEGTPAAPASSANQLFAVDGIDAPIVASAPVADASSIGGALLLERLELPAGVSQASRTTASAELYYVESGALSIQDDFGFGTTIPAGNALPLNAGTTVTLSNQGAEPAVVLRLRLSDGAPVASDAAAGEATPVDLTAGTTQGADEIAPTVLVQMPVSGLSLESGQIFLSRATFSPGSATGEQGHAGPIGLYVESGALNVVSPSGFQGTIGAGQGVSLPAETPLQASTVDAEAVVLIVGLGAADAPFGAVTPEPVAATEAATEVATEAVATEIPEPTEEVVNAGTVLQLGETWEVDGATMTVSLDESSSTGIAVNIAYTNLTDSRVDFLPSTGALRVYDDQRSTWTPREDNLQNLLGNRIILEPGETIEYYVGIYQPNQGGDYSANTFIVIEGFGQITYAKWGFTYNNGRVLTIPPDAVDPTVSGQNGGSADTASADSGVQGADGHVVSSSADVLALMPTQEDIPDQWAVDECRERTLDDWASEFSDPTDVATRFTDWGWSGQAHCLYLPTTNSDAEGPPYINVNAWAMGTPADATAALHFWVDEMHMPGSSQSFWTEIAPKSLGQLSRAVVGNDDEGEYIRYFVQQGNLLISLTVALESGKDPEPLAIDMVTVMLGRMSSNDVQAGTGGESGELASMLPADSDVSSQLVVANRGALGADEITATFSDPAAASRFFNDWGWQENAFAYYEPPNGGSSADGLVYVDVGLHRFATADGASQALTYFADVRRDQMGLGDVQITPIGEQTRALMGSTDMGTEASVYARVGTVAIRVSVMSVGTDPLSVAVGIVQGMVGAPQASAAPPANAVPVDLFSLLPGAGDVPAPLVVTGERNRTLAEVAENYVNPADTTALFTGWGWQGNVTRAWQLPSGANVELTQINGVYVSIHMFDDPQGAAAALDLSLVDQSALTGAWEVGSPGLGDYSRALWGQETYGNEITLLVQRGNVFIRVSAAQLEGDPTPVAAGIVQGIIGRAG